MNKHVMTLAAFCSVVLAGCQQSEGELDVREEYPVSIEASIGDTIGSRYVGDEPNEAVFESGDNIGLAYKVGTDDAIGFVKWTLDEEGWNPSSAMSWKNLGENHTFYAFYPYGDDLENVTLGQVKMPVLTGQDGTMSSVAARDFLVATKTMKYSNGGEVSFTGNDAFKHVSSLVVFTLNNTGDLASAKINNITLTGTNLVAESTYSFTATDTEVSFVDASNDDIMSASISSENSAMDGKFRKFYFVVNSETVNLSAVTLSITYKTAGGEVYKASRTNLTPTSGHTQFQKGFFYNYSITVSTGNELIITGYNINEWDEGGSLDVTINGSEKQN